MTKLVKRDGEWSLVYDYGEVYIGSKPINDKFDGAKVIPKDEQESRFSSPIATMSAKLELDAGEFESDIDRLISKVSKLRNQLRRLSK